MQASHVLFTHKVVARVLESIEMSFDETNELARFRPKLTQCMLTQMLPGPAASGATLLVPRLLSVLKLAHLRSAVHATLRDQVCSRLWCVPCGRACRALLLLSLSQSGGACPDEYENIACWQSAPGLLVCACSPLHSMQHACASRHRLQGEPIT